MLFVRRDTGRLDAERVTTDLGAALVTTIEQTLLDLAHRPDVGGVTNGAQEAVRALWPRADPDQLEHIAAGRWLRTALRRACGWVGE